MHAFIQLIITEPVVGRNRGSMKNQETEVCDGVCVHEMSGWWERRADSTLQYGKTGGCRMRGRLLASIDFQVQS